MNVQVMTGKDIIAHRSKKLKLQHIIFPGPPKIPVKKTSFDPVSVRMRNFGYDMGIRYW
jgi:hypothetical protein